MKYRTGRDTGGDVPPSVRLDVREERRGDDGRIGDGGGGSTAEALTDAGRRRHLGEERRARAAGEAANAVRAAAGSAGEGGEWAGEARLRVGHRGAARRLRKLPPDHRFLHHATQTDTAGGALRSSFRGRNGGDGRAAQQFQRRVVDFVKRRAWVFVSRKIGRLLNWLQVLSALACVALSFMRLWKRDFGAGDGTKNKRPALLLFYTLTLLEASLFLREKAYWSWKLSFRQLLHEVSADCELGAYGPTSLTRFFYDAYSRCLAGSIFDGIKMDLVAFAEDLIQSDFLDEQLIGARILQQFAATDAAALWEVGASPRSIDSLIEMITWKRPDEEEVRRCAAEVVAKLASRRQNALRVSAIPGAIESIMSLLHTAPLPRDGAYDHLPFNLLGLLILKRLAEDHDNCGKIGTTRGLLAKIIDFTRAPPTLLRDPHAAESQVRAVKRALQLVKMLVSATGSTGKALRQEVAENVFSVSHLRGVLQHGGRGQHRELRKLAIDVLTGLAMEDTGKVAIVSTGGVIKLLLSVFAGAEDRDLGCEAGEALAILALESKAGCSAILKAHHDVLGRILPALQVIGDARRLNAARRALRNLCAYSGEEHRDSLRAVTEELPAALNATLAPESDKILETSIGLTSEICRFIDGERFSAELSGWRASCGGTRTRRSRSPGCGAS
ncbi:hypothetical protein EJB05_22796, partial [Eragrostis curvula]